MNKSIATALLALAACAPAAAQTYELTFSGTFTTLIKEPLCDGCSIPPFELSEPVPFSGTFSFTVAPQSTISRFDDHNEWSTSHTLTSTVVDQVSSNPATAFPLNPDLTIPHGTVPAAEFLGQMTAFDRQHYGRYNDTGNLSSSFRTFALSRTDMWSVSAENLWFNWFQLSVETALQTPGAFEDPMTSASFIEKLRGLVGCAGCMEMNNQSSYVMGGNQNNYSAGGTATLLSFRELASPVPEPSSILMLACGVAVIGGLGWRRRRPQG